MAIFVNCSNKRIWFGAAALQQLQPAWNTPIQGSEDPEPEADPEGTGPISVTLSDRTLLDTDYGFLDLTVEGLSLGQTILLERFLVDNSEGIINPGAFLLDSRRITDGYLPKLGDEPNYNETLDYIEINFEAVTERDGIIETYFPIRGGLESIPGEYVYRVSSPVGSFPPVNVQLTIEQAPGEQSFTGRVLNGATPVPGALVGVLQSVGSYSHLSNVARADQNGFYRIYAPFEDEFELVAIAPGYVGPLSVGTDQVITFGSEVNRDLQLTRGTQTLSGVVVDSVTDEPIAGLPITFITVDADGEPTGESCTHNWTDAKGEFTVSVTPGRWGITFKSSDVSSRNYLVGFENVIKVVEVSASDQTNLRVPLVKGTSLIWGTLLAPDGSPLEDVEVFAYNDNDDFCASGVTYEDGTFFLGVTPGHWTVFPFSYDLEAVNYPGSYETTVYLSEPDQSIQVTITTREMGGILEGLVTDPHSDPVAKLRLLAFNVSSGYRDSVIQTTYASSGYYNFYLSPGTWVVFPDSDKAAARQLLFNSLPTLEVPSTGDPFTLNRSVKDIDIIQPTGTVELTLLDSDGKPISGIKMHGASASGQHAFGRTDENGVAHMPVINGDWQIHLSSENLRIQGKQEVPLIDVTVSGPTTDVRRFAVDFDDSKPSVTSLELNNDAQFYLTGSGEPGRRYVVEGSRDLVDWRVLGRVLSLEGEFSILDDPTQAFSAAGTETPSVFYRVVGEANNP